MLELFGFEVVARIILIRDGERNELHVTEILIVIAFSSEGHHAQDRGLCAVVGVFCSSFALSNPNVVFARANDVVHVATHVFAGFEQLSCSHRTAHEEGFVHAHKLFYPRMDEQIVTDGDLCGVWETVVDEYYVEHGDI